MCHRCRSRPAEALDQRGLSAFHLCTTRLAAQLQHGFNGLVSAGSAAGEAALRQAEQECLQDAEARRRRQEREAERRVELDQEYVLRFAKQIRVLFPSCPNGREQIIAEHACQKYSGRVGRSAGAKRLDEEFIRLAVVAHIRHRETNYDELLSGGVDRRQAREQVQDEVDGVLDTWKG